MKAFLPALLIVATGVLLGACSHVDLTPPGPTERVLIGVVSNNTNAPLPPDTEVTVRVVDVSGVGGRMQVLGDQVIQNPGAMPVPYRVEFTADDAVLRRGLNLEARISIGGRLRYTTVTAHPITAGNVHDSHVVDVVAAQKH